MGTDYVLAWAQAGYQHAGLVACGRFHDLGDSLFESFVHFAGLPDVDFQHPRRRRAQVGSRQYRCALALLWCTLLKLWIHRVYFLLCLLGLPRRRVQLPSTSGRSKGALPVVPLVGSVTRLRSGTGPRAIVGHGSADPLAVRNFRAQRSVGRSDPRWSRRWRQRTDPLPRTLRALPGPG